MCGCFALDADPVSD